MYLHLSFPSSVLPHLLQWAAADKTLLDVGLTVACKRTSGHTHTDCVCVFGVWWEKTFRPAHTQASLSLSLSLSFYLSPSGLLKTPGLCSSSITHRPPYGWFEWCVCLAVLSRPSICTVLVIASFFFLFLLWNYKSQMQESVVEEVFRLVTQANEALSHFKKSNTVWYY